ncbi:MAG: transglutaminase-like domain-containing protein [Nanoarchaeota archaeon]|nr:transglutaminase-like domain-containing protein [Nanoarchaeota archaeon]MBU4351886.1 transglutaminase-like domain-containing protein [Nanoarchaeota archaeon]MBU4456770.1 transglutaminase-like domain-containing protein [Nanoarchaeota archaeon]MCG2719661.1 transglutaminase-like domain-containing protein [Nanoarchaeota archaeon]
MVKINYVLIALLFIMPLALAENVDNYNDYGSLEISVKEEASIIAEPDFSGGKIRIDNLNVELAFFPKDSFNQIVLEQNTYAEPNAEITEGEVILYHWKDPKKERLKFFVDSKVKTINKFPIVKNHIPFPYNNLKEELEYLEPTESIDINEDIKKQATEIIQGQTDYYKVTFKLGEWVQKNIKYNLNTLTENAVQSASWVLKNREGVCDEITNLYIALLRSVGIPARFVAGQVYSNLDYKFGNHGWAEVYFPEIGWVPVDVTYSQIGWIDPSHIKFQQELDPKEPSANYNWKSIGTDMTFNPIFVRSEVTKTLGVRDTHSIIKVEPLRDKTGASSFVPIKVTIKNLENYYLPSIIQITTAPNLTETNRKALLLEPNEERTILWISQMPAELEDNYLYETKIEAKSTFSDSDSAIITLSTDYEVYDKAWAEERVERLSPREDKAFFPEIKMDCWLDKEYYYVDEKALLKCSIENQGNTNFQSVKICYETNCYDKELLIRDNKETKWEIIVGNLIEPELKITAESKNLIKENYPILKIIREPKIVVHNFEPKEIDYSEIGELSFTLSSNITAYNMTLNIPGYGHSFINRVFEEKDLVLPFEAKTFKRGNAKLELKYYDEVGKEYSDSYNFNIRVMNLPWYEKLLLWVEKLLS